MQQGRERRWSEAVEDLVQKNDVDGAIEVLEALLSRIGFSDLASASSSSFDDASRLDAASAKGDLANLLDSRGSSMRANELRRQIIVLRGEIDGARGPDSPANSSRESEASKEGNSEQEIKENSSDDVVDDWETAADLPLPDIVGKSRPQEPEIATAESPTRRRGRGHFQYEKNMLYSDQIDESESAGRSNSEEDFDCRETSNLSRSSRALSSTSCQFKLRMMEDTGDPILSQISSKGLEPPIPRPKTSARTAQRMIAQSMGLKVNSSFGSKELRIQERERKSRIQARQDLKDNAWGSDDP